MKVLNEFEEAVRVDANQQSNDALRPLVVGRNAGPLVADSLPGAVVGALIALTDNGIPLVTYPGQSGSAALAARSVTELSAAHIGKSVLLVFESGDGAKPIVLGIVRDGVESTLAQSFDNVEVDTDGQRMTVTAKEQLVLRCGKARITLTRAGKVLIEGVYISSRSSGVNRIRGGSVHLN